jgi:sugar phosphate isomerase/epimerase
MTQDWRQRLHLGVVHSMLYPGLTDEEAIVKSFEALALDPYLDVIEVQRREQPGLHVRLRALAEATGVKLVMAAQPGLLARKLSLNDPDEAGRQAAVEEVKRAVDAAYELGARLCVVLSGPRPPREEEVEPQLERLAQSCTELCRYSLAKAQERDYVVWLSLEQFDATIDKRCLIGPSSLAAELARRVREEVANFGLTVDLSHVPLLEEPPEELVGILAPYLIHVHVGNALRRNEQDPAYGDKHPRFGYPDSEHDWPQLRDFLAVLTYAGYFEAEVPTEKPIVSFEVQPFKPETSEQVWAHSKRTWLRAWAELGAEE